MNRLGFARLTHAVARGQVGAEFGLEKVSRLVAFVTGRAIAPAVNES